MRNDKRVGYEIRANLFYFKEAEASIHHRRATIPQKRSSLKGVFVTNKKAQIAIIENEYRTKWWDIVVNRGLQRLMAITEKIMFDRNLTMRIDDSTDLILKALVEDLNFSKAEIVRKSLRLLKELHEIKKQSGEILVRTEKGERVLVLLS